MSQDYISGKTHVPSGPESGIDAPGPGGDLEMFGGIDFTKATPGSHAMDFSGVTLQTNANLLRAISTNPARTSGWTAFSGTVTTTPAQVYTDYRELHTAGVAEVLGFGGFTFMDSGANCASLFAGQFIAEVDPGATIAASSGPMVGVAALSLKTLINNPTAFNASGSAAVMLLSFQANVLDVSALDTSFLNMEIASGGIRSIFKIQDTAAGGATFLFDFTDDLGKPCSLTNGSDLNDISATANAGWIKVRIGSTTRYIALYEVKA